MYYTCHPTVTNYLSLQVWHLNLQFSLQQAWNTSFLSCFANKWCFKYKCRCWSRMKSEAMHATTIQHQFMVFLRFEKSARLTPCARTLQWKTSASSYPEDCLITFKRFYCYSSFFLAQLLNFSIGQFMNIVCWHSEDNINK